MERASLKFVLLFILLVFTSKQWYIYFNVGIDAGVLRSVEATKCVRDSDCYFQCRPGFGICDDKRHKCFCLPREKNYVESTADCTHDGGCN
ncbi:hypothetical protein DKX38_027858 [Salix brachista]|uniref:Knottin scorpion toxin-like domain-containing protein n=1 Tax=Salix brachista TaxID=2182728 RepID=A0A5N5J5D5_9ROSI|nr:hypothetical protein DKX38_027858 [Salix brachista]